MKMIFHVFSLNLLRISFFFPLAFMINHSFSLGIFTKTLKTGKVLPIFKKGLPYFLLFQKFMNVQFTIELLRFLTATISLLPINLVLEKIVPQIMPFLTLQNVMLMFKINFLITCQKSF